MWDGDVWRGPVEIKATIAKLKQQLATYGRHTSACAYDWLTGEGCDCGWAKVKKQ